MRQQIHQTFIETDRYTIYPYQDRTGDSELYVSIVCRTCPSPDDDDLPGYVMRVRENGAALTAILATIAKHEQVVHHAKRV